MSEDEKRVPKLRFQGFEEEWEEWKLKEIAERITRKNVNNESAMPLTISAQYGLVDQIAFFNNRVASKDVSGYYVIRKGEFAYNKSYSDGYPYGAVKRLDRYEKGVLSTLYIVFALKSDKIRSDFLVTYYDTSKWYKAVAKRAAEGARNHGLLNISAEDFFDTELLLPGEKEEQAKIGNYFESLNKLIYSEKNKIEHLKEIKTELLRKMFPEDGKKIPELRFPGFTDEWELHKLGDIGETYSGLSGKVKSDFGHGEASFITYMNVFSNPIADLKMLEPIEIDDKQNEVNVGDVFFTTSSETPEEVGMSSVLLEKKGKIYLNSFCFGYRPKQKIEKNYLAYMLRSFSVRKQIVFLAQGISRYNISKNRMMEIEVPLPNLKEQIQIGNFFYKLHNLISLHERKLDHLQQLKKGLLEQMFV